MRNTFQPEYPSNIQLTAKHKKTRAGQALVETALAMAFLMLLLAAAVDAGLAYKSYQMLINATANASSYLAQFPYALSPGTVCDINVDGSCVTTKAGANDRALIAFRNEQGGVAAGARGGTLDLNTNGTLDDVDFGSTYSNTWAALSTGPWFRIDEASSTDVKITAADGYGVAPSFAGTSDEKCKNREQFDSTSSVSKNPCYIVVRATVMYKPFFLSPVFGSEMTIRAISIKPIVGNPTK